MSEPIGYRNECDPQPTNGLTGAESALKDKLQKLATEIHVVDGTLKNLKLRQIVLMRSCKHAVFMDERGFPYHNRKCCICGAFLGSI